MSNGLLALGLVEVVVPRTNENLGYVFTEQSGRGQLQRWLLYQAPNNHFELRPPPPEIANWSLSDWTSGVFRLWRPNSYYIRAQTDVYEYGRTYNGVSWSQIPRDLPNASYPSGDPNFQLDPVGWNITVTQWTTNLWGLAYTVSGMSEAREAGRSRSREYWVLPAAFQPAGTQRTVISVGSTEVPDEERFLSLARGMWAPGATFAITGCHTHFGESLPRTL